MMKMSGVDIQYVRSSKASDQEWEKQRRLNWEIWSRIWMGLKDSPYRSIQWLIRLKLEAYGDRRDKANPFHWDRVELRSPYVSNFRRISHWIDL